MRTAEAPQSTRPHTVHISPCPNVFLRKREGSLKAREFPGRVPVYPWSLVQAGRSPLLTIQGNVQDSSYIHNSDV
jgi:hypothetical protein